MIRTLLATTALATMLATGAIAQTSTTAPATSTTGAAPAQQQQPMVKKADGHLASDVLGKSVYNGTGDDAKNIGKVSDLVLDDKGQATAIVVGVGGFLGIGQKDVALEYNLVKWSQKDDKEWLVVETTADALKAQPEFDADAYEPQPADAQVSEVKPATKEDLDKAPKPEDKAASADTGAAGTAAGGTAATADTAAAPADDKAAMADDKAADDSAAAPADDKSAMADDKAGDDTAAAPADDKAAMGSEDKADDQAAMNSDDKSDKSADASSTDDTKTAAIDRSKLKEMPVDKISADDFIGTTVYGSNDDDIGEIDDVIMTKDGKADAVIVDVGGFLGVGEKSVAVSMENLSFMTDEDGKLYLYTNFTEDQLKSQPEYDKDKFADSRDEMLMTNEKKTN